jgi:superfamily II DNA helicase RecQ
VALTATAVENVRQDIAQVLGLREPHVAQNSSDRPNLKVGPRLMDSEFRNFTLTSIP